MRVDKDLLRHALPGLGDEVLQSCLPGRDVEVSEELVARLADGLLQSRDRVGRLVCAVGDCPGGELDRIGLSARTALKLRRRGYITLGQLRNLRLRRVRWSPFLGSRVSLELARALVRVSLEGARDRRSRSVYSSEHSQPAAPTAADPATNEVAGGQSRPVLDGGPSSSPSGPSPGSDRAAAVPTSEEGEDEPATRTDERPEVKSTPGGRSSELASLRMAAGLTQAEIGEALGVSRALVSQWERGRRVVPESHREAYANTLGVALRRLVAAADDLQSRSRNQGALLEGRDRGRGSQHLTSRSTASPVPAEDAPSETLRSLGSSERPTLADLRREAGLTQAEVAASLGVSQAMVSHWELGRSAIPGSQVEPYANTLQVAEEDLPRAAEPSAAATAPAGPRSRDGRPSTQGAGPKVKDETTAHPAGPPRKNATAQDNVHKGPSRQFARALEESGAFDGGTSDFVERPAPSARAPADQAAAAQAVEVRAPDETEDAGNDAEALLQAHRDDPLVLALLELGEPATASQIMELTRTYDSVRSIKPALSRNDAVKRTFKRRYGLVWWPHDEYTGVSDEIAQKIEEAGGVTTVDHLLRVVPEIYEVSPSSVRSHLSTPKFVVEENFVRLRTDEDPPFQSGQSLFDAAACYSTDGQLVWRVPVDADVLRGSGRLCPAAFVESLGVRPGDKLELPAGPVGSVRFGWPLSRTTPAVGSLRAFAEAEAAEDGDFLLVRVHRHEDRAEVTHLSGESIEGRGSLGRLALLCGLEQDDGLAEVSESIGLPREASPAEVRSRLRQRGEHDLAELVPVNAYVESLDTTALEAALVGIEDAVRGD